MAAGLSDTETDNKRYLIIQQLLVYSNASNLIPGETIAVLGQVIPEIRYFEMWSLL